MSYVLADKKCSKNKTQKIKYIYDDIENVLRTICTLTGSSMFYQ